MGEFRGPAMVFFTESSGFIGYSSAATHNQRPRSTDDGVCSIRGCLIACQFGMLANRTCRDYLGIPLVVITSSKTYSYCRRIDSTETGTVIAAIAPRNMAAASMLLRACRRASGQKL